MGRFNTCEINVTLGNSYLFYCTVYEGAFQTENCTSTLWVTYITCCELHSANTVSFLYIYAYGR